MNLGNETETLEFKKSTGELKEAMQSISAILNKHGVGTLYFGIRKDGEVLGQVVSESSLRDVSRVVYEKIQPQIYPVITDEVLDGKHCIKVEFNGDSQPYSADGRYYLRTADEDRVVSPEELKKFFIANEYKEKWEKTSSGLSAKQVDRDSVKYFTESAIKSGRIPDGKYSSSSILKRFSLINGDALTNAGMVLFGNNHPVTLKAAVFATDEKLSFLDMKLYEDNIYNLLRTAEKYILENIRWRVEINGAEREEIPEIPAAVIREALANSFAHAVYNSNTYHEICIYPGKVTIYSTGQYASNFDPEDYIHNERESVIRNEKISKMLYLSKTIEQFGSGFKRIDSFCKDAHIKYDYEKGENGFTVIFYRKNENSDTTKNVTMNVAMNVVLNKTEEAVYTLLKSNPKYTIAQLSESTAKTGRTIQRVLDSLKEKGLIERAGSRRDGYWITK